MRVKFHAAIILIAALFTSCRAQPRAASGTPNIRLPNWTAPAAGKSC